MFQICYRLPEICGYAFQNKTGNRKRKRKVTMEVKLADAQFTCRHMQCVVCALITRAYCGLSHSAYAAYSAECQPFAWVGL